MQGRMFRKALLEGQVTIGAWLQIGHPASAELLARAGFDWVCIDLEHGVIDLESAAGLIRTLRGFDCVPVARIPANEPIWIHRILDAGVGGLIVPMVNNAEEARQVVQESLYPPDGRRGYGYSHANGYGISFEKYRTSSNDELAIIVQIEQKEAIDNLESILEVERIDGLFLGPLDLSGSMGITGQLEHPRMVEALDRFRTACAQYQKSYGIHLIRPDGPALQKALGQGYNLLALGLDTMFLFEGAREAVQRAEKGKPS